LVHDDVIDGDELRRNMPTLWKAIHRLVGISNKISLKLLGRPKFRDQISFAVLAGDALWAKALLLLSSPEAFKAFADSAYALLKGAMKEAMHPKEYMDKGIYYTIITMKTASLFANSCYLGALCSSAPAEQKEALRQFGKRLGIMYQMVDDYVDGDAPRWLLENFEEELEKQKELALNELRKVPESEYRDAMEDCVDFMLARLMR
jgi:geranylgeranyl pyrophosphate synthase